MDEKYNHFSYFRVTKSFTFLYEQQKYNKKVSYHIISFTFKITNMPKTEKKYSEAIAEIETIISNIEQGTVSIDELTEQIKKASELLQLCKQKLTDIENQMSE